MELLSFEPAVIALADLLRARGWRMASAESCTGGLIAAACTALSGSSDWFERGFVTYSNAAKAELLGVDSQLIAAHGAVSEEVARAMAEGALQRAPVQCAVAVTGIAGPGGAVPGKPVGTVWLAWGSASGVLTERLQLPGDRDAVRGATVAAALQRLIECALRAERRAAPSRPVVPSGAKPGREQSCGLLAPGEELGREAERGLQGRPTYPSDEGPT